MNYIILSIDSFILIKRNIKKINYDLKNYFLSLIF